LYSTSNPEQSKEETMQRPTLTRLIFAALAVAVLLMAALGLPGAVDSSAGEAPSVRLPRPHPQSHIATPGAAILGIRPHPISHVSFPAGIDLLNPRPHPESHLGRALHRP
jgi:hypothetical protein